MQPFPQTSPTQTLKSSRFPSRSQLVCTHEANQDTSERSNHAPTYPVDCSNNCMSNSSCYDVSIGYNIAQ